jgi:hypothetical protein
MTLSDITAQFTSLMNRRDLTANTSLVTTFIDQGLMRIQRELRVPAMEKSVLMTIDAYYTGLVIPSDLLELIQIIPQATNAQKLRKCDISRALQLAQTKGIPEEYCRQGGMWILGNSPSAGDVIRVDYYAELQGLVNPTDTNVVSLIAWDLIVYAALVQAAIYFKDKRAADFEIQYQQTLAALQAQSDEDDTSGGAEVMPAYSYPQDPAVTGYWGV